jgi:hypothetical protein
LKNSSALRAAILLSIAFGSIHCAEAADYKKIFGTWTLAGSTPNPNLAGTSCGASSYAFTSTVETVRLLGGAMNGLVVPTNVKYVSGKGNLVGVYGSSGQPTIFRMLDDNRIQRDDDLQQCVFRRQK